MLQKHVGYLGVGVHLAVVHRSHPFLVAMVTVATGVHHPVEQPVAQRLVALVFCDVIHGRGSRWPPSGHFLREVAHRSGKLLADSRQK